MMVSWLGFEQEPEETWKPLTRVMEDIPGIPEDYLYSSGEQNLKGKILDLNF